MEHHLECRLWRDVFAFSEDYLKVPVGSIRVTVMVETLPAAFEIEVNNPTHNEGLFILYVIGVIGIHVNGVHRMSVNSHPGTSHIRSHVNAALPFSNTSTSVHTTACTKGITHTYSLKDLK